MNFIGNFCLFPVVKNYRLRFDEVTMHHEFSGTFLEHGVLITHADSVGRTAWVPGSMFSAVYLSVCSQHNLKTNDPKVSKLGIENDFGIYSKWYAFEVKSSKVKVTESISLFCILKPLFIDIR